MRTYENKDELKKEINKSFAKYIFEFNDIPESLKDKRVDEVDRTPAENLAYQVGWTTLVLKWEADERKGLHVKTPSDDFKWNQLGELYQWFTDTYAHLSLQDLKEHVINKVNEAEIVKEQKANPEINVFTGIKFPENTNATFDYTQLSDEQRAYMATLSEAELAQLMQTYSNNSSATYENNLSKLGVVDLDNPASINLYPKDFASKDKIADIITDYNNKQTEQGKEENVINYTDLVGIMMSSVSTIINVISYVLIAFVGISLVVSSIMIGIITYISVLERTKEIGILRSIGASKKDVSRVFNAETLLVGLVAGLLGIVVTLLLDMPINIVIKNLVGISGIAKLPVVGGIILVAISVGLTMIAGLIPARFAAKRDPVEALRTE